MAKRKSTGARAPQYKREIREYNNAVKEYNYSDKRYRRAHRAMLKHNGVAKYRKTNNAMYHKFEKARNRLNRAKRSSGYKKFHHQQIHHQMFINIRKSIHHKSTIDGSYMYIAPNNPASSNDFVYVKLSSEEPNYNNNIDSSSTPEKGLSISANSEKELDSVSISGLLGGQYTDTRTRVLRAEKRIKRWTDNRESLYCRGNVIYPDVTISTFTPQHSNESDTSGENALNISLTFTIANYAESNVTKKRSKSKHKGKKSTSKGVAKNKRRRIWVKRGDTFYSLARRSHQSVSALESKSKYKPTQIPANTWLYY